MNGDLFEGWMDATKGLRIYKWTEADRTTAVLVLGLPWIKQIRFSPNSVILCSSADTATWASFPFFTAVTTATYVAQPRYLRTFINATDGSIEFNVHESTLSNSASSVLWSLNSNARVTGYSSTSAAYPAEKGITRVNDIFKAFSVTPVVTQQPPVVTQQPLVVTQPPAEAQAEAQLRAQRQAGEQEDARVRALVQAQAQAEAEAQARRQTYTQEQARLQEQALRRTQEQAQTSEQRQARAQARAQIYDQAYAETYAEAIRYRQTPAQAQAKAQSNAETVALRWDQTQAYAQPPVVTQQPPARTCVGGWDPEGSCARWSDDPPVQQQQQNSSYM
jgi:hypothetical protein